MPPTPALAAGPLPAPERVRSESGPVAQSRFRPGQYARQSPWPRELPARGPFPAARAVRAHVQSTARGERFRRPPCSSGPGPR